VRPTSFYALAATALNLTPASPGTSMTQPQLPEHPDSRQLMVCGSSGSMVILQPPEVEQLQLTVTPTRLFRISAI
jgi:hypothetical protein